MERSPDLLTAGEVAQLLGVSDETVRRWTREKRIRFVTLPTGRLRFDRSDVEALLTTVPVEERAS